VQGLSLSGTVTSSGNLTLGGTLSAVNLTSQVTGTLPVANGGTGATSLTSNNVIIGNGTSAVQFVAPSTTGNVLTSNGTTWTSATPAVSASGLTFLSTVTASASATVDMETTFSSTYDAYLIIGCGIVFSNDGARFGCRLKIGGSYSTADYKGHYMQVASGSTSYAATANATDRIGIGDQIGNVTNEGLNFTMKVYLPSGSTLRNMVTGEVVYTRDSADVLQGGVFLGGNTVTGAVTGVRFFNPFGNITSGVFRLYGIANS
jgi:hypothetical protein